MNICSKTEDFIVKMNNWSRDVFGDPNKRKRRLHARLVVFRYKLDYGVVNDLLKLEKILRPVRFDPSTRKNSLVAKVSM